MRLYDCQLNRKTSTNFTFSACTMVWCLGFCLFSLLIPSNNLLVMISVTPLSSYCPSIVLDKSSASPYFLSKRKPKRSMISIMLKKTRFLFYFLNFPLLSDLKSRKDVRSPVHCNKIASCHVPGHISIKLLKKTATLQL